MNLVIASHYDAERIRSAIDYAQRNPDHVKNGGRVIWNRELEHNEWRGDYYIVGKNATLDDDALGPIGIRCEVFLALGKVEVTTMKVFAKYIFFLNDLNVAESLELNASEAGAFIGNAVKIKGNLVSKSKSFDVLKVELLTISKNIVDCPIQAGLRLLHRACQQVEEEKSTAS